MSPFDRLTPVDWRITYGNPRKGRDPVTVIVRARTAGEAKAKANEIARKAGITTRMGTIRLLKPEAVA